MQINITCTSAGRSTRLTDVSKIYIIIIILRLVKLTALRIQVIIIMHVKKRNLYTDIKVKGVIRGLELKNKTSASVNRVINTVLS